MELVQQKEETRASKVHRVAYELFRQNPDWVTFFREILGVEGVVRQVFQTNDDLAAFEHTSEYAEIQVMVAKLRERAGEPVDSREPTRVITVRLPASLHESLRTEAHERKTSMNKLCISKLLQIVDEELVPND
jgi:predicted HicB family RNase H-like nuclease